MRGQRKLGMRVCESLCYHMAAIRKHHNLHNVVLYEDRFANNDASFAHFTHRHTHGLW